MDLKSWLHDQNLSATAYNADELLGTFVAEMEQSLTGGGSSLEMIPAYVGVGKPVPSGCPVAVVDAGGFNLRICLVHFDDAGHLQFDHFFSRAMPGVDREQSAAEFYEELAQGLIPLAGEFENVGFCFAYAAEILPNYDGRLLYWTKGVKIPDMVGKCIGSGLLNALGVKGFTWKRTVLLNDTTAVLLAGVAQGQRFNASSYIGFVLGGGINCAYIEQNRNITRIPWIPEQGTQVISMEAGGFSKLIRSEADLRVDRNSLTPGGNILEKMTAGVYLGTLSLEIFRMLADKGVFSESADRGIRDLDTLSTVHIADLFAGRGADIGVLGSEIFSPADLDVMKTVFASLVERAALLSAVCIGAGIVKSGEGTDPGQPVCVTIDGSTYYKVSGLECATQGYLKNLLDKRGLSYRCIHVDDAPITGAAIAGLTTFD